MHVERSMLSLQQRSTLLAGMLPVLLLLLAFGCDLGTTDRSRKVSAVKEQLEHDSGAASMKKALAKQRQSSEKPDEGIQVPGLSGDTLPDAAAA